MTSSRSAVSRRRVLTMGGVLAAGLGLSWLDVPSAAAGTRAPTAARPGGRELYFPPRVGDQWAGTTPAAAGWDAQALERALDYAGDHASTGVVVLHRGRILAERYWRGAGADRTRDIASAQKSVVSLLVGIAVGDGRLGLDDRVTRWLGKGWSHAGPTREAAVTVRHLLAMTSGLDMELEHVAPPGSTWFYNNNAYHLTHALLESATGQSLEAFASRRLFATVGMRSARWRPRPDMVDADGKPLVGLLLTPRDMARFGLLTLAGGGWDGRELVERRYVTAATSTSQRANLSYGLLWWLNGKTSHVLPGPDPEPQSGSLIPDAPADLVAALGKDDQKIYVVPSLDLVVARQGAAAGPPRAAPSAFDNRWWELLGQATPR